MYNIPSENKLTINIHIGAENNNYCFLPGAAIGIWKVELKILLDCVPFIVFFSNFYSYSIISLSLIILIVGSFLLQFSFFS